MNIFTGSNETLDKMTDSDRWIPRLAGFAEGLRAVQDLQSFYDDTAKITNHGRLQGYVGEFKHVASIRGSILNVAEVLDEDLLQDDRRFYGWLDRHPEYCAYRRNRGRRE